MKYKQVVKLIIDIAMYLIFVALMQEHLWARYRAVYLVYRPYHLEFPLVSVPFQRKIHSDKDNISSYQYCTVCCYAVLYGKFGAGFGKGFCFSEFGRCKDRHDASPRIDCANKLKKHRQFLWAGRIIAVLLAAYGVYVFVDRAFYEELFYLTEFKFFDTDKSAALYFFETIAMSAAFATLSYYGKKLLQMKSRQTKI